MAATMRIQPTPASRRPRWLAGFTMIELLVVVTVAALLLSLAVPSMSAMVDSQKAVSLLNAFVSSLNLARSEAIKRNARVVVCKSATGLACASSGGWEQGWIVFHDANNNATLDTGETVVQQRGPASGGLQFTGNLPVARYVSFGASGSSRLVSGAFQAGTFTLCPAVGSGVEVRKIVLSGIGRFRAQKGNAGDCL